MNAQRLDWAKWVEMEIPGRKKIEGKKKRQKDIGIAFKEIRNGRIKEFSLSIHLRNVGFNNNHFSYLCQSIFRYVFSFINTATT